MRLGRQLIASLGVIVALGMICAVALSGATSRPTSRSTGGEPFCGRPVIHDYERTLRRLPSVKPLPVSGSLPFGPTGLEVRALGTEPGANQRLLFVGSSVRYQFTNVKMSGRGHLGWTVKAAVFRMAPDGSGSQIAPESIDQIDELGPRGSVHAIDAARVPGLGAYRIDLTFLDEGGQPLGSYSEYVQAVRSTFRARLGISNRSVRAGRALRIRVENLGTQSIAYGAAFVLARFKDGAWIVLPPRHFYAPEFVLFAGSAGSCERVHIPRHAQPGLYRISKEIVEESTRKELTLRATFRVR
jgi:hypothetical protein